MTTDETVELRLTPALADEIEGLNSGAGQASHLFHNLTSSSVLCFTVPLHAGRGVDWARLARQGAAAGPEDA